MSARAASRTRASRPAADFKSSTIPRLPRFIAAKQALSVPARAPI
jgi:hypothetical protein